MLSFGTDELKNKCNLVSKYNISNLLNHRGTCKEMNKISVLSRSLIILVVSKGKLLNVLIAEHLSYSDKKHK